MDKTRLLLQTIPGLILIMAIVYYASPKFEEAFEGILENYLSDCEDYLHKMFKEMDRNKIKKIVLSLSIGMGFLGLLMTFRFAGINIIFTILFFTIGFQSFRFWLKFSWHRRTALFNDQLVDSLNLIANSLKSGLNLSQAIQVLVQESQNPTSQEFSMVLSQEKLGLTLDESLEKILERIPSEDLAIAVHSVLILRETGGDLSETFETIATTIRERRKVTGKIETMTSQGRLQGLILILMPFALMAMLYMVSPPYIIPLFTTPLGWIMLLIMLILQGVGAFWVKKIVTIDV